MPFRKGFLTARNIPLPLPVPNPELRLPDRPPPDKTLPVLFLQGSWNDRHSHRQSLNLSLQNKYIQKYISPASPPASPYSYPMRFRPSWSLRSLPEAHPAQTLHPLQRLHSFLMPGSMYFLFFLYIKALIRKDLSLRSFSSDCSRPVHKHLWSFSSQVSLPPPQLQPPAAPLQYDKRSLPSRSSSEK